MYCYYKKRECGDAGSIVTCGCKELGETPGLHTSTICYKEGGYINCKE